MDSRFVTILRATFILSMASICALAAADEGMEDSPPPARTKGEIDLAQLTRNCRGDEFTRAIRAYIKNNGAQESIPYLIYSFGNDCSGCPDRAQLILVEIGAPAVPALIAAAQSRKKDVFGTLSKTFAMLDPAITMSPLSAVLRDGAVPHREYLLDLVVHLESKAKGAIPALLWILEEDPGASLALQYFVAEALCAIGPDAGSAGPAIIRYLNDLKLPNEKRPARRRSRPSSAEIAPPTFRRAMSSLWFGTDNILASLGKLGMDSEGVLDYLLGRIETPEIHPALDAIALMGPAAGRARPTLREALKTIETDARPGCCYALCKTGEPFETVSPFILNDLNDRDLTIRIAAMEVVRRIGPAAGSVFPELLNAISGGEGRVRELALKPLASIKPPSEQVIPHLIDLLKTNDPDDEGETAARHRCGLMISVGLTTIWLQWQSSQASQLSVRLVRTGATTDELLRKMIPV